MKAVAQLLALIHEVATFMGSEVYWPFQVEPKDDTNFAQHFSRVFKSQGWAFVLKMVGKPMSVTQKNFAFAFGRFPSISLV